jgi:hypothetical protein
VTSSSRRFAIRHWHSITYDAQHQRGGTLADDGQIHVILFAKYRDLDEQELLRRMLYQLTMYAVSQQHLRQIAIVSPTMNKHAKEARIDVQSPLTGQVLAQVCLRPIALPRLELLLADETGHGVKMLRQLSRQLALET